MKLTWFGNTAFRIHIGGQIVVVEAGAAPAGVDAGELVSGADRVIGFDGNLPVTDSALWRPRPRERLLDAGDAPRPVAIVSLGPGAMLFDADEDMPLLLLAGAVPELGRWAKRAAMVLVGEGLAERALLCLERAAPRFIALAGADDELDTAFARLPPRLDGAALVALEPGLAVEV